MHPDSTAHGIGAGPGSRLPALAADEDRREGGRLRRMRAEDGATMIEYAVMVSLVAMMAFLAVQLFGAAVLGLFSDAVDVMP